MSDQRTVIITGAGKGLGRAYAHELAARGTAVIVNNRVRAEQSGPASADQVVEEIRAAGGEAVANYDGVEDPECGQRLLDLALTRYGRLDGVIANAGIQVAERFDKMSLASFAHVQSVNLMGTVHVLQPALKHLRAAGGGRVVISTSSAGLYGNYGLAAYASSKAALVALCRSLAFEGDRVGIKVNAVAPYAETQMTEGAIPDAVSDRFTPDRVATLVAWLVDPDCDVTGKVLIAGGGGLRLAHPSETSSVFPGSGDAAAFGDAIKQASDTPLDRTPLDARSEFLEFASEIADRVEAP